MSEVKEQISANRRDTLRRLEQVREDRRLSDEGQNQMMHEVHSRAMERHKALIEQHQAEQEKKLEDLHYGLFSPSFKITEPDYMRAGIRSEFRKALVKADNTLSKGGVEGLQRFLEMAQLSGDRHVARAAFSVAHSRVYEPVVEAYLAAYPEERGEYEGYRQLDKQLRNPDPLDTLTQSFELAPPPRPPEIANYRPPGEADPISAAGDRFFGGLGEYG